MQLAVSPVFDISLLDSCHAIDHHVKNPQFYGLSWTWTLCLLLTHETAWLPRLGIMSAPFFLAVCCFGQLSQEDVGGNGDRLVTLRAQISWDRPEACHLELPGPNVSEWSDSGTFRKWLWCSLGSTLESQDPTVKKSEQCLGVFWSISHLGPKIWSVTQ